jgi:hypothetical protein
MKFKQYLNETKWQTESGITSRLMDKSLQVQVVWKPGQKEVKVQFQKLSGKNPPEFMGHVMVPTKGMKSKDFLKHVEKGWKDMWGSVLKKRMKSGSAAMTHYDTMK